MESASYRRRTMKAQSPSNANTMRAAAIFTGLFWEGSGAVERFRATSIGYCMRITAIETVRLGTDVMGEREKRSWCSMFSMSRFIASAGVILLGF